MSDIEKIEKEIKKRVKARYNLRTKCIYLDRKSFVWQFKHSETPFTCFTMLTELGTIMVKALNGGLNDKNKLVVYYTYIKCEEGDWRAKKKSN